MMGARAARPIAPCVVPDADVPRYVYAWVAARGRMPGCGPDGRTLLPWVVVGVYKDQRPGDEAGAPAVVLGVLTAFSERPKAEAHIALSNHTASLEKSVYRYELRRAARP